MTHKQLAKLEKTSLATAYRHYPIDKYMCSQADIMALKLQGYSVRQIAILLSVPKSTVWRWCN